jgi:preprotein translocase subunit YajC
MIPGYAGKASTPTPLTLVGPFSVSLAAARHVAPVRFAGRPCEGEAPLVFDYSQILLFAQQEEGAPNPIVTAMPLLTIVAIFFLYMMLVQRPAMKREQETRETMIKNMKKNDRIVTTGGIYGTVTNIQLDADEITIRVDESTNTKIKITRSAVQRVLTGDGGGSSS